MLACTMYDTDTGELSLSGNICQGVKEKGLTFVTTTVFGHHLRSFILRVGL